MTGGKGAQKKALICVMSFVNDPLVHKTILLLDFKLARVVMGNVSKKGENMRSIIT